MAINANVYKADAVHVVRAFLLAKVRADLEMLRNNEGYPYDPFVPSQQQRELVEAASGLPFITYTYTTANDYPDTWMKYDTVVIRIYGDDEEKLRMLKAYIDDVLSAEDTAEELTDFAAASAMSIMRTFTFHNSYVQSSIGPEPYEQEGGRQLAVVTARYNYTVNNDQKMYRSL